jgi:hypothetical protein
MHACIRKYTHDIQWSTRSLYCINLPNGQRISFGETYSTNEIPCPTGWAGNLVCGIRQVGQGISFVEYVSPDEKYAYAHPHTHSTYTRVPTYNSKTYSERVSRDLTVNRCVCGCVCMCVYYLGDSRFGRRAHTYDDEFASPP